MIVQEIRESQKGNQQAHVESHRKIYAAAK